MPLPLDLKRSVRAPFTIYRIARRPDPWQFPDWSIANPKNRFDDPNGEFRVLYASSSRIGCFIETLAWYRPNVALYAELQDIEGDNDFVPPGRVPRDWDRLMGSASTVGDFADVCDAESIAFLRAKLATILIDLGMDDLDGSALRRGPRRLTQEISAIVFAKGFNGIRYLSKYGDDLVNWALFEPANLINPTASAVQSDDPDLREAFRILNLAWE